MPEACCSTEKLTHNDVLAELAAGWPTEHMLQEAVDELGACQWDGGGGARGGVGADGGRQGRRDATGERGARQQGRGGRRGVRLEVGGQAGIAVRALEEVLHALAPHEFQRTLQALELRHKKREREGRREKEREGLNQDHK